MAGIYIHIPFCVKKCPYCDFVSFAAPSVSFDEYADALYAEINNRNTEAEGLIFDTIYIGGGTPSLFPAGHVAALLARIQDAFKISDRDTEISIEANPESVSEDWLKEIRHSGINRISLGIQDFSERGLRILERPHSLEDAYGAVSLALAADFETLNIDMMFGIPGQGLKDLERSLAAACRLGVNHISCYELTLEQGTRFEAEVKAGRIEMPGADLLADMTDLVESYLSAQGYRQYEISNFAVPGHECRHNLNYWANGRYIGLGCSAVSFLNGTRSRNMASLRRYMETVKSGQRATGFTEHLDHEASFRESVVLGLRTNRGISCACMEERFGINPLKYYGQILEHLLKNSLMEEDGAMIRLTRHGRRVANSVLSLLV